MAAVSDTIVREFFEMRGYLVNQPRKHVVPGRQKAAEEEIDLLVVNPQVVAHKVPDHVVWVGDDLATIGRAVVAVRGWHSERFYASTVSQAPDILRFVEEESLRFAAVMMGEGPIAKVLCLPRLPASDELKEQTITLLREKGIDGIMSFETLLTELIDAIDVNRNYEKSDLLQAIRILKNYDLLVDRQLEFFGRRRR